MYVRTYARTYVRTYVCIYVCMYLFIYLCNHVCMDLCMYVWTLTSRFRSAPSDSRVQLCCLCCLFLFSFSNTSLVSPEPREVSCTWNDSTIHKHIIQINNKMIALENVYNISTRNDNNNNSNMFFKGADFQPAKSKIMPWHVRWLL